MKVKGALHPSIAIDNGYEDTDRDIDEEADFVGNLNGDI